jgi:hypothetical protein
MRIRAQLAAIHPSSQRLIAVLQTSNPIGRPLGGFRHTSAGIGNSAPFSDPSLRRRAALSLTAVRHLKGVDSEGSAPSLDKAHCQ